MPNRSATRASGFINPADGLSFSGAVVVQDKDGTLSPPPEVLQQPAANTTDDSNESSSAAEDFVSAGLADSIPDALTDALSIESSGFSAGLLSPRTSANATSSLSAEEDDTVVTALAESNCDTSHSDKYCVYTIEAGDTLSAIAELFGIKSEYVDPADILVNSNKPDIVSKDDILSLGQKIRVPLYNGSIHTVLSAQTLTEIAEQYGVTIEEIMEVSANGIGDANDVSIGVEILIPNPQQFAPIFIADESEPPVSASEDSGGDSSGEGDSSSGAGEGSSDESDSSSSSGAIVGGGSASGYGFIWPVSGPISSYFGPGHPLGIDIDLFNNRGASIAAAMGGVVTFAGGNPCCSYGYYVVVDHGNGYQTLYAHLSSIGVSVGEVVGQGQYLGNGGTTGYSTGDHLHFEIQRNGSIVNPLNYLP